MKTTEEWSLKEMGNTRVEASRVYKSAGAALPLARWAFSSYAQESSPFFSRSFLLFAALRLFFSSLPLF